MLSLREAETAFEKAGFRLTHETAKVREYTSSGDRVVYWDFGGNSRVDARPASYATIDLAISSAHRTLVEEIVHPDVALGNERGHSNYRRFPKRQLEGKTPIPVGLMFKVSTLAGLEAILAALCRSNVPIEQIDERLLAVAVEKVIRPLLIDQGLLHHPDKEGYHHGRVIPKAQELLGQLPAHPDPARWIGEILDASENLVYFIQRDSARRFFAQQPAETGRQRLMQLLDESQPLDRRLADFLAWAEHPGGDDPKAKLEPGIASYLLAVSQPTQHAWCKPTVYSDAAAALLGRHAVRSNPVDRQVHADQFYAALLPLLRDRFGLPFHDLWHVHIALYVVGRYEQPDWQTLRQMLDKGGTAEDERRTMINSTLPLNCILYGPPGTGKTYTAMARAVRICDGQVPGDGAELVARFRELQQEGRVGAVTFHQSYSYEDFVEGIRPVASGTGIKYRCRPGIFRRMCDAARDGQGSSASGDPTANGQGTREKGRVMRPNYVLLIDEINRGNISKIFGELITLVEEDKREGGPNCFPVRLPYSGRELSVPGNLYIIGTMNTTDRSIALLDTALRRRFRFEEMMPDVELVRHEVGTLGGIDVAQLMAVINRRIEALFDRDHQIGHSFFLKVKGKDLAALRDVFVQEIIPLLQEYFYGDWPRIAAVLGDRVELDSAPTREEDGQHVIVLESLEEALPQGEKPVGRVRYGISRQFSQAPAGELTPYFQTMLGS